MAGQQDRCTEREALRDHGTLMASCLAGQGVGGPCRWWHAPPSQPIDECIIVPADALIGDVELVASDITLPREQWEVLPIAYCQSASLPGFIHQMGAASCGDGETVKLHDEFVVLGGLDQGGNPRGRMGGWLYFDVDSVRYPFYTL